MQFSEFRVRPESFINSAVAIQRSAFEKEQINILRNPQICRRERMRAHNRKTADHDKFRFSTQSGAFGQCEF